MEIIYTAKQFNEIWSYYLGNVKVDKDEEIPQTKEFKGSFFLQKKFAEEYRKNKHYDNRPILSK